MVELEVDAEFMVEFEAEWSNLEGLWSIFFSDAEEDMDAEDTEVENTDGRVTGGMMVVLFRVVERSNSSFSVFNLMDGDIVMDFNEGVFLITGVEGGIK